MDQQSFLSLDSINKKPERLKFLIMQKKFAAAREIINKISHTSIGEDFEFNEQELEVFSEG